jgi:hypothetical protein
MLLLLLPTIMMLLLSSPPAARAVLVDSEPRVVSRAMRESQSAGFRFRSDDGLSRQLQPRMTLCVAARMPVCSGCRRRVDAATTGGKVSRRCRRHRLELRHSLALRLCCCCRARRTNPGRLAPRNGGRGLHARLVHLPLPSGRHGVWIRQRHYSGVARVAIETPLPQLTGTMCAHISDAEQAAKDEWGRVPIFNIAVWPFADGDVVVQP